MRDLISKREQDELRKAAIEYVRCWKAPVSHDAAVALKNLHTAARAFAEKTDAEWAAEVAELKDALREYREDE